MAKVWQKLNGSPALLLGHGWRWVNSHDGSPGKSMPLDGPLSKHSSPVTGFLEELSKFHVGTYPCGLLNWKICHASPLEKEQEARVVTCLPSKQEPSFCSGPGTWQITENGKTVSMAGSTLSSHPCSPWRRSLKLRRNWQSFWKPASWVRLALQLLWEASTMQLLNWSPCGFTFSPELCSTILRMS